MFADYSTFSEEAKVWIYPSSRKFYPQEIDTLNDKLQHFITHWKSDTPDFKASFQLLHQRFIVFIADEHTPLTHTDIDQQVGFIIQLQEELQVELLDKMNVCFKQGEFIQYKEVKEFKKLLKNKSVSSKTIVFDNLIQTKHELENDWEMPITDSWYNRFL